jgi:plastocyanin
MKKILLNFFCLIIFANLNAQQTFTVNKGSGNSFSPSTLNVSVGDIVHFNLSSPHDVTQVSQTTWDADGTTPLPGGFVFPSGSGNFTATTPGTIYYVCTIHVASDEMKGTITVSAVTGINDIHNNTGAKLYPNPASDFITFKSKASSAVHEIRIVDITGKTVKILQKPEISDYQVRIEIASLNKGIYFILVKSDDGIEFAKFMKA